MSITFNQTRNEIIQDALYNIQAYGIGETVSNDDMRLCERRLNSMIKAWQAQGIHLFTLTEGNLFLEQGVAAYDMSSSSTSAHATNEYVSTTLTAAALIGAVNITVTSATGMAVSDNIGIINSDGDIIWETITSIAGTTIGVTALSTAVPSGAYVFAYTTKMDRPLRISRATLYNVVSETDVPLTKIARQQYFDMPTKLTTADTITQFYYDPQIGTGKLYVWPTPNTMTQVFKFTYERSLADMLTAAGNPDFPQEWLDAIIFNLSVKIAPAFGKSADMPTLKVLADEALNLVKGFDNEDADMYFTVDTQGH